MQTVLVARFEKRNRKQTKKENKQYRHWRVSELGLNDTIRKMIMIAVEKHMILVKTTLQFFGPKKRASF